MRNDFDERSAEYRQYRPGYPDSLYEFLIDRCGLSPGARVLDVGAGTGKASTPWHGRRIPAVAVEQSLAMIGEGRAACAGARYVCANAEAPPFRSGAFDLVTSAQSFHLFDPARALPEFARVLKPGGFFALFWYRLDLTFSHTRDIARLLASLDQDHAPIDQAGERPWRGVIESGGRFKVVDERQFSLSVPMTADDWIGLARTIPALRAGGERFEQMLLERLSPYDTIDGPYVTDLWLARAR
jgi:SAM-dependent methyltransferase